MPCSQMRMYAPSQEDQTHGYNFHVDPSSNGFYPLFTGGPSAASMTFKCIQLRSRNEWNAPQRAVLEYCVVWVPRFCTAHGQGGGDTLSRTPGDRWTRRRCLAFHTQPHTNLCPADPPQPMSQRGRKRARDEDSSQEPEATQERPLHVLVGCGPPLRGCVEW